VQLKEYLKFSPVHSFTSGLRLTYLFRYVNKNAWKTGVRIIFSAVLYARKNNPDPGFHVTPI
jgi:hypothetical protein